MDVDFFFFFLKTWNLLWKDGKNIQAGNGHRQKTVAIILLHPRTVRVILICAFFLLFDFSPIFFFFQIIILSTEFILK